METTRVRFGSILEWLFAAAFFVAALAVVSALVSELRTVRPVVRVMAGESLVHEDPAGIPARSIAVPMLLLRDGRELRLGDAASQVAAQLGDIARVRSESVDGGRTTRFYEALGLWFVLVFESPAGAGEPRVAAIYRQ